MGNIIQIPGKFCEVVLYERGDLAGRHLCVRREHESNDVEVILRFLSATTFEPEMMSVGTFNFELRNFAYKKNAQYEITNDEREAIDDFFCALSSMSYTDGYSVGRENEKEYEERAQAILHI